MALPSRSLHFPAAAVFWAVLSRARLFPSVQRILLYWHGYGHEGMLLLAWDRQTDGLQVNSQCQITNS